MRTLRVESPPLRGPDVLHVQHLLAARGLLPDSGQDGMFGPQTGRACVAAKETLGYPDRLLLPICGPTLVGYLSGAPLPPAYARRAAARAAWPVSPIPAPYAAGLVLGVQGHVAASNNREPVGPVHDTAGLDGYPAIDFLAAAGSPVRAPEPGLVRRFSGHDPAGGPVSGIHGPFGWSLYLLGQSGTDYYMTHLGSYDCRVGDRVPGGKHLATVGDYARFGGVDHTHVGVHGGAVSIVELGNARTS